MELPSLSILSHLNPTWLVFAYDGEILVDLAFGPWTEQTRRLELYTMASRIQSSHQKACGVKEQMPTRPPAGPRDTCLQQIDALSACQS